VSRDRLRVTLRGAADLIIQLAERDIAAVEPPARGEWVLASGASYEVIVNGWRFEARVESARRAALRERAIRQAAERGPAAAMTLRARLPGRVVRLWVSEGQEVEQGDRLLAVEAMKMENEVRAPHAGRVTGLRVEVGGRIELGDELLTIA
jgi:biotin carboxyl carrier protein